MNKAEKEAFKRNVINEIVLFNSSQTLDEKRNLEEQYKKSNNYRKLIIDLNQILNKKQEIIESKLNYENSIKNMEVKFLTYEEAKRTGNIIEWNKVLSDVVRYAHNVLPKSPKGNIDYFEDYLKILDMPYEKTSPYDLVTLVSLLKDETYDKIKNLIKELTKDDKNAEEKKDTFYGFYDVYKGTLTSKKK